MGYANENLFRRYPNEIAKAYGVGVHRFTHDRQVRAIKDLLEVAKSHGPVVKVLDCPCGSGRISAQLANCELTCADRSEARIAKARQNLPATVSFETCDGFKMPFQDGSFDATLTILLLQRIPKADVGALLKEVARVTRRWAIVTYSSTYSAVSVARKITAAPDNTLTQREFNAKAVAAGLTFRARRRVLPGLAATVSVLLEKK
ncbi:MAG: class I SAM-dependent methyltransferase [Gammaproteobacteria bacterium]